MANSLLRPSASFDPASGLLRTDHFQVAYSTNDLERACAIFSDRFGVRQWQFMESPFPEGGLMTLKLAWVGSVMYELIDARGPGSDIWASRLPADEFVIQHHHLGYLIHDKPQWDALTAEIERGKWNLSYLTENPGFLKACYVEVPVLGHYFEYIFPEEAGYEYFQNVPAN